MQHIKLFSVLSTKITVVKANVPSLRYKRVVFVTRGDKKKMSGKTTEVEVEILVIFLFVCLQPFNTLAGLDWCLAVRYTLR